MYRGLSEYLPVEAILVGIGKARSWYAAGNRGEVDRSRVARLLLQDLQTGKLLFATPPPSLPFGSRKYSDFIASTHRARYRDLMVRKKKKKKKLTSENSATAGMDDGDDIIPGHDNVRRESGFGETEIELTAEASQEGEADAVELAELASLEAELAAEADGSYVDELKGDLASEEAWMDAALAVELHGDNASGAGDTRLRSRKNKKMTAKAQRIQMKGKRAKGRKKHGDDPYGIFGDSGTALGLVPSMGQSAHAAGVRHNKGEKSFSRAVLPHHPSYGGGFS